MKVRYQGREGNWAADWVAVVDPREGGGFDIHIERQVPGSVETLSPSRAMDLFRMLATRSRPVSEKVAIFQPKK